MANINKITVDGVEYKITIPSGLTAEEQAQVRENIGAISSAEADVVRDGTYPDMTVGNATKAQNADTLANARAIDGVSFNGSAAITHYGVCSTPAGTTAKTVALTGFTLVTGARITVKFTTANTVSSPTLNINGTSAKAMKCKDRTTGLAWKAGELMTLVYDGTNWCIVDGYSLADRPVNTHYIQYNGESAPGALFGGTWEIDTDYTGRVLVGSNGKISTNTDRGAYYLGAKGGEESHMLIKEEIPNHNHAGYIIGDKSSSSANIAVHTSWEKYQAIGDFAKEIQDYQGQSSLSLMQPYKVVAVWKRTA